MAQNLTVVRKTGPESVHWSGVGSRSIGVVDIPLNAPFQLREIQVRLGVDEVPANKRFSGSASLEDRKSEEKNSYFTIKTADECFSDLKRAFPKYEFEIVEYSTGSQPTQEDRDLLGTTLAEVKRNFKKLSKQWHPDLFHNAPWPEQQKAEREMKRITGAYERLSREYGI